MNKKKFQMKAVYSTRTHGDRLCSAALECAGVRLHDG